jgi:NADPH-dependent 2,4-dienoyl-CoA reductase/sulfur reductase-like enzyme
MIRKKKLRPVIIGNSTAAIAAAETIHQYAPEVSSILIAEENHPPYSPTALIAYSEGKIRDKELFFRDAGVYRRNNIEEKLGKKAVRVDPTKRIVILEDGEQIAFSTLLIATGARPNAVKERQGSMYRWSRPHRNGISPGAISQGDCYLHS